MKTNSLQMISKESLQENDPSTFLPLTTLSKKQLRHQQSRGKYEREWLENPEQFMPDRSWAASENLERAWNLLHSQTKLNGIHAIDLGCGSGWFSLKLAKEGAKVTAVDIASNALRELEKNPDSRITTRRDFAPYTKLEDGKFDVAVALDLIAELDLRDHRILISELSRLVHKDGWILISTPLDLNTINPLERFIELAKTELDIIDYTLSHYLLADRFYTLFPGLIKNKILKNRTFGQLSEKITRFFYDRAGVTHIILLGKRKSFYSH
jgi:2-polyprenyl-3-methyl-5-hydroxy-6-metoxy-1,4-benzoquinol methylase